MIQTRLREFYHQHYGSLRPDEVEAKLLKVFIVTPALLALGAQTFGSCPLLPIVTIITVVDAIFHKMAVQNYELCKKTKKYEPFMKGARCATLIWSIGHLFQSLGAWTKSFPLLSTSILKLYTNYDPQRWLFRNNIPIRPMPYVTDCFDKWAWSWQVTIAGILGIRKLVDIIHKWITKDQFKLKDLEPELKKGGVEIFVQAPQQVLLKASLLLMNLIQLVVDVSLVIFSKSRWIFAGVAGVHLYTLCQVFLIKKASLQSQPFSIRLNFKKLLNGNFETVQYQEKFFVHNNPKQEVRKELEHLLNEIQTFAPFNMIPSRPEANPPSSQIHVKKIPNFIAHQDTLNKISDRALYILGDGPSKKCELIPLDYQVGAEISMHIQEIHEESRKLRVTLTNGTIVDFPNVSTRQILKKQLKGKTIKGKIQALDILYGQLYLTCSSDILPKSEKLSFECKRALEGESFDLSINVYICKKEGAPKHCRICSTHSDQFHYDVEEPHTATCKNCLEKDLQTRLNSFKIVNGLHKTIFLGLTHYVLYAEKEQLPEGSKFSIKAKATELGESEVIMSWLDYKVGDRLSIQLKQLLEEQKAITLLRDNTIVLVESSSSEALQNAIQSKTILQVQIIDKDYIKDRLVLTCISRAFPMTTFPCKSRFIFEFTNFEKLVLTINSNLKAKTTKEAEDCSICCNPSEVLFYACSTQDHAVCFPCLGKHINTQLARLKLVNPKIRYQGQFPISYQTCLEKDSIPNCMLCRQPLIDQKNISVKMINNSPVQLIWLTYKIDDIIQFKIQGLMPMPEGKVCILGELSDGTIAAVNNLNPIQAITFQLQNFTIHAKISSKTIENGRLYLNCEFERVS